jgi:hypothetical protein
MSTAHSRPASPNGTVSNTPSVAQEKETQAPNSRIASPHNQSSATDAPFSYGFFDKDPASVAARQAYMKAIVGFTVITALIIWGVVSIYWGAFWRGRSGAHNMHGWIVDFDGGDVGRAVTQAFQAVTGPKEMLTWVVKPASDFPGGPDELANEVGHSHPWAAVAIHNGATSRLANAVSSADSSYNGSLAITAYGNQARNENAFNSIIQPALVAILTQTTQKFAAQHAARIANGTDAQNLATLLTRAPQVVTQPIFYTINNVHPFDIPVATAVTFVGLIYLLVISFIIVNATAGMRLGTGLERRLTTSSLIKLRVTTDLILFFFLSLCFSLISLFFQVPFRRHYGNAGFFIYWMLCFVGMSALGLALDAMLALLTLRFVGYFMIFFIIINVSVCSLPIEILPTIYRYGRAMPFYNVNLAVRSILFGTANTLGLNFGILIVWVVVSLITLPLFMFLARRRTIREAQEQQRAAAGGERA